MRAVDSRLKFPTVRNVEIVESTEGYIAGDTSGNPANPQKPLTRPDGTMHCCSSDVRHAANRPNQRKT